MRTMAQDHSETLNILGADEHDCGPVLARQRMAEIQEWRQRAKTSEQHRGVLETALKQIAQGHNGQGAARIARKALASSPAAETPQENA